MYRHLHASASKAHAQHLRLEYRRHLHWFLFSGIKGYGLLQRNTVQLHQRFHIKSSMRNSGCNLYGQSVSAGVKKRLMCVFLMSGFDHLSE